MRFILIGNYPLDKQESMERFAMMLHNGFSAKGIPTEIWRPKVILGRYTTSSHSGIGKWLGYIDKWILFPFIIKRRVLKIGLKNESIRFHICDHSNAPYLCFLPAKSTVITCHDVLAIRGAFGYTDAYCPASIFGVILQKWILHYLLVAKRLAFVSNFTFRQLVELRPNALNTNKVWKVIHNGFNADFNPLRKDRIIELLSNTGLTTEVSFILHVGSDLDRKNRKLLLDMVAILGEAWKGIICYAGKPIDKNLMMHAIKLGLQNRIISIVNPTHSTLKALYNACEAFIFPSLSEGFGWPVIEAQACGTPVITSNYPPMPEVSGGAAIHIDPTRPEDFATAFLTLRNPELRKKLVASGFENAKRFETKQMIHDYLKLHDIKTKPERLCSSN